MKKIFNKSLTIVFTGILLSVGCTKDFVDINSDPTTLTATNFDPNTLLPSIQLAYAGPAVSNTLIVSFMSQLAANCATTVDLKMTTGDKYLQENHEWLDTYWEGAYTEQVKPVVELMALTRDKPEYANLYQIARIMKALILHRVTDVYGDVPYFQAGLGYHETIFYPAYDKQELIYADLLKEIEEATDALDPAGDKPTGDEMYQGDIEKWKRFGYSLLLRAGMRLVNVDETTAKETVTKVLGKTMGSIADNAFIRGSGGDRTHTNNLNSRYLLGDFGYFSWYFKWSDIFIDFLQDHDDPRLSRVAEVNVWTDQVGSVTQSQNANNDPVLQKGLPNGLSESTNNNGFSLYYDPSFTGTLGDPTGLNAYSSPSSALMDRKAPTFFLTYAEAEFLLAEAAARWGAAFGNPEDHYNNGIRAAMATLSQYNQVDPIAENLVDDYVANVPYNPAKGLEMINTQYWAETGTTLNFHEAWINWRRSGFPVLKPVDYPGNITSGTIPRRYIYPVSEAANNADNLNAAINEMPGGDRFTTPVWWDSH